MKNLIISTLLLLALLLPATATAYSFKYGGLDYTITGINTVEVSTRHQTDPWTTPSRASIPLKCPQDIKLILNIMEM